MNPIWIKYLPAFARRRLEGRQNLQNIVANTGWLFADKIVRMGLGVLVTVWLARYLGPERFGALNFVLALVAIFSTFSMLGLDSIVIRDIVHDDSCTNETLGSATWLKLLGSMVTIAASIVTILVIRPNDAVSLWMIVLVASGTMFQALDTIDFLFQAHLRSKYTVYARNAAFLVASSIRVALILAKAPLVAFALTILIEALAGAIGLAIYFLRSGNTFSAWRVSAEKTVYLLRESWPLILQGIVIMIYMRIDQVMLGHMTGDKSVGEFSAAVRLVEVWYFIPMALTASLFPEIVKSRKLSAEEYKKRIQSLYDLMIWMAITIAVLITFIAPFIIATLYGEQYRNAATILSIQTWIATSVFFGVARQKWLTAEGYLKDGLYVDIAGMMINVIVNLYLIPQYGAIGASMASLVAAFGANFIAACFSRPIRKSMQMYGKSLLLPFRLSRIISAHQG